MTDKVSPTTPAPEREDIAEIIHDWIHENQVTHRRTFQQRSDEQKAQYYAVADRVIKRVNGELERLRLERDALVSAHVRDIAHERSDDD